MTRPSRRTVVLIAAVVVVGLLAANVMGLWRYPGGPLRLPNADGLLWLDHLPDDQGNNNIGFSTLAGVTTGMPIYVGLDARNQWSTSAVIEGVRLVKATPGLRLIEARLARRGATNTGLTVASGVGPELDSLRLYEDYRPVPADLGGNAPIAEGQMWLLVLADAPGEQSFDTVALDYRIGPFSFTVDMHQGFSACIVPMPSGVICSWDAQ
ncbi:MAG: hypothetical protein ABI725_06565 [Chloroflexota bacterium]